MAIFSFQSQFLRPIINLIILKTFSYQIIKSEEQYLVTTKSILRQKINLIILKTIFVSEYQIRRLTFSNNISSLFRIHQIRSSKNVSYICQLSTKVSKNTVCTLDYQSTLSFTGYTIKLHNFYHTTAEYVAKA